MLGCVTPRVESWTRYSSSSGTFRSRRPSDTSAASSEFGPPSRVESASSPGRLSGDRGEPEREYANCSSLSDANPGWPDDSQPASKVQFEEVLRAREALVEHDVRLVAKIAQVDGQLSRQVLLDLELHDALSGSKRSSCANSAA